MNATFAPFDSIEAPAYQPRGLATCLRCGHLVRVARADGADVELVDPERRAAGRWAELLGLARPRALSVADRRAGHAGRCFGLDLGAARPERPERLVEVDVDDGLGGKFETFRVVEDLGEQDHWKPVRHYLRVEPLSGPGPFPGPGDLHAYRVEGEGGWILWPYRILSEKEVLRELLGPPRPAPTPAKPAPDPKLKRLRIAGVPWRGLEYLGYQPLYRGWAWRAKPWGEPDDGRNESVAIKRPGESQWRIARDEDRIGGRA